MHNLRPARQNWPADAFNFHRQVEKCDNLAFFFHKNILFMRKNIKILFLKQNQQNQKFFFWGARHET